VPGGHIAALHRPGRSRGNARPVSFGWLSDDFGTPGVVGDPTQATRAYGVQLYDASVAQAVASLQEIARFSHRPGP